MPRKQSCNIQFPISRSEFRELYFEKSPYLVENSFATDGLGWEMIDSALDMQDPSPEKLKLLSGGLVEPSLYLEEFIDIGIRRKRVTKHVLYQHLNKGGTVVVNRIELVSSPVRALCLSAGQFVGAQTTANAYASFGPEVATNVHWDTHDVLVLQLKGKKRWRLYAPTHPLPVVNQVSHDRKGELIDAPVMDLELEQGSCLYVPRGWWHKVEPVSGFDTIHLAVAIHVPLILDYLIWAAANILPDFPEVRHALLGRSCERTLVDDAMSVVSAKLSCQDMVKKFHARNQERERVISPFNIAGLVQTAGVPDDESWNVTLNTRILFQEDGSIMINGTHCHLNGVCRQVIDQVRKLGKIPFSSLISDMDNVSSKEICSAVREMAIADIIHLSH